MTGTPRTLGLVLALSALTTPALANAVPTPFALTTLNWSSADEVEDLFKQGVELLSRGKDAEALKSFQMVLAKDPSHEQAYRLWKNTDHKVWMEILTKQGDFELVARRLMGLAEMGRAERKNDGAAIKAQLDLLRSENSMESRKARNTLAAEHGEYAVAYMLPTLGDQGSDDRRVLYMHTLTEMDSDVVIPLIEALNSPDAFLKRNVALVLGYIGDSRAGGMLAHLAKSDTDGGVRSAASTALAKCKSSGDALTDFLKAGEAYALRQGNVLSAHQYSDVVWSWTEKGLASMPVARAVYGDELSKKNYDRALAVDSNSMVARAGLARAYAAENAKLAAMAAAGADVSSMAALTDSNAIGMGLIGAEAIDHALSTAVRNSDHTAGRALIHALAAMPNGPTGGLMAALGSKDGAMRSEAAVALGDMAVRARSGADGRVVAMLGEAVGREVVRTAFVIEANADIRQGAQAQAEKLGFASMGADRGANALALLHRVPGVDAVIVSDSLPDLTTFQVIADLRAEPRFEKTPIFVLSANPDQAKELFGDSVSGVIANAGDMAEVATAVGALTGDRAEADQLATKAAVTLGSIAAAGGSISEAIPGLISTLAKREDGVSTASMATLALVGDSTHVSSLVAVLADASRSDAARTSAAHALAGVFARGAAASSEDMTAVFHAAVNAEGSAAVRTSAARAVGAMQLQPDVRAEMLRSAARTAKAQG